MSQPKVILFAGPIGSSKTPIAFYLSHNLDLPIFQRDIIRTEVLEDMGQMDNEEFERKSKERLESIVQRKMDFILDTSIDRKYDYYKALLKEYDHYIISLDISKDLLTKLYKTKRYMDSLERIDSNYKDHQKFLSTYSNEVSLSITDKKFNNRLGYALRKVREWYTGYSSDG